MAASASGDCEFRRVGVLPAGHRAADDDPPQGGEEEQVEHRLAVGGDAGRLDPFAQLRARQRPSSPSARSIVASARSATASLMPSWRRRRALEVNSGGVVSACSQG